MTFPGIRDAAACATVLLILALPVPGPAGASAASTSPPGGKNAAEAAEKGAPDRVEREGLVVEFSAKPAREGAELMEGEFADISFRITDKGTGKPVRSLNPGAILDLGEVPGGKGGERITCRERVSLYLQGMVGIRPLIDLNSYFVLALNREGSISVIDPHVGMAGRTYLYANIPLKKPGADWAKDRDERRLFVTMPQASGVAVLDMDALKVIGQVEVGGTPVRIALQGDGRYLWVGNDAKGEDGGVAVFDPSTLAVAARIPTGRGHHEIAFSADGRHAFVSNQDGGTVSVIDIRTLSKVRDLRTGPRPVSMAYSRLSDALYVVDGEEGAISVVDAAGKGVLARIPAKPGPGGMIRFTEDGRWGVAANPGANVVYVVDASTNRIAHEIPVEGRPFEVAFSGQMAYIRSLDSERVSMIGLSALGGSGTPPLNSFAAGDTPPGKAGSGPAVAPGIVRALGEAAVLVANPSDGNVYFYMEGMVSPMATFRNYGHRPAALAVANRSLREREPGVYSGTVRFPVPGEYDVAMLLDAPRIVQCFQANVAANPAIARKGPAVEVEFLNREGKVRAGGNTVVRFRLIDPVSRRSRPGVPDVTVLSFQAPGRNRRVIPAKEVGEGVYEAEIPVPAPGAYYVYVTIQSLKVSHLDHPYFTLVAVEGKPSPPSPGAGEAGAGEKEPKETK